MNKEEIEEFSKEIAQKLDNTTNPKEILNIFFKGLRKLIPYDYIQILKIDNDKEIARAVPGNMEIPLEQDGIISYAYRYKQPLIVNDLTRSLLFNKDVDKLNFDDTTRILVYPIVEQNNSKSRVLAIIWLGMGKSFKQFLQDDVEKLSTYIRSVKNKIFALKGEAEPNSIEVCLKSKRDLEKKLENVQKYYASVIHDIRTPMNAIMGFLELLDMLEEDTKAKEYIDATLKSGEHILSLINDTLDISKIAAGKMTLNKSNFSPMELLSDLAKLFYNAMLKKGIHFHIFLDPRMPSSIYSDPYRIKQIINNLLSNALKFTPEQGTIELKAIYKPEPKILEISVKDTGIGISKDKQRDIFKPYQQESSSTATTYGGTGLGLAISQQLSVLLGGKLTLESKKGKGSTFTLILPCENAKEPYANFILDRLIRENITICYREKAYELDLIKEYLNLLKVPFDTVPVNNIKMNRDTTLFIGCKDDISKKREIIQEFLDRDGKAMLIESVLYSQTCQLKGNLIILSNPLLTNKIFEGFEELIDPSKKREKDENISINKEKFKDIKALVLDDNVINMKMMSEILKQLGVYAEGFTNPLNALKVAENKSFDIIFVDKNMPIMNGEEFIAKVRESEKRNSKKPSIIYALTGAVLEEEIKELKDAGANRVYQKPIHIVDIYKALEQDIKR